MNSQQSQNLELDPVLVKREQVRKRVKFWKRIGYGSMLISIVTMFLCIPFKWPLYLAVTSMVTFVVACIVLPLPIIFGYAIKAAEKEDKKMGF
ncbi:MAG: hypothetical protein U0R17_01375 [Acidimicrobiia bacterium]